MNPKLHVFQNYILCKWVQAQSSTQLHYPSKSDSKLYTYFEFCDGKILNILGKNINLQSQVIYAIKFFSRKVYIFYKIV